MDELDRRIIVQLVEDARRSYADIGQVVGLSAPAVKRRVDRLRERGVITGFTAVLDPEMVGWTTEAFVEIHCGRRTSPAEIAAAVRKIPEVVAAYTVTGEADALVHVRAANTHHFEEVLERLRESSNISHTKSTVVLSRLLQQPTAVVPQPPL